MASFQVSRIFGIVVGIINIERWELSLWSGVWGFSIYLMLFLLLLVASSGGFGVDSRSHAADAVLSSSLVFSLSSVFGILAPLVPGVFAPAVVVRNLKLVGGWLCFGAIGPLVT